jgi:hypothetical protein
MVSEDIEETKQIKLRLGHKKKSDLNSAVSSTLG